MPILTLTPRERGRLELAWLAPPTTPISSARVDALLAARRWPGGPRRSPRAQRVGRSTLQYEWVDRFREHRRKGDLQGPPRRTCGTWPLAAPVNCEIGSPSSGYPG